MQYIVRFQGKEEKAKAFVWLEEQGYNISPQVKGIEYPYVDVIIDYGIVFGSSASCFAAAKSGGMPLMSWEKWLQEKQAGKLFC